jgi:hypothetical protein
MAGRMLANASMQRVMADGTLVQRASTAAAQILGPEYANLILNVLEGARRGTIGNYSARILLERCLPTERPIPVQLPVIDCAADLVEADRRLMAAANSGAISHREWGQAQENILRSWEIRKQARLEEP